MFGSKKDKNKKVKAAPAASASNDGKVSTGKNKQRHGMSSYFHESVPETVLPDFKSNTQFAVKVGGVEKYVGLFFDTNEIGGFSRQFQNDEAKGSIVEMINSNRIKALITPSLMARECMILIPDAATVSAMNEFELLVNCPYRLCFVTDTSCEEQDISVTFEQIRDIIENDGTVASLLPVGMVDVEPEVQAAPEDAPVFEEDPDDLQGEFPEDDIGEDFDDDGPSFEADEEPEVPQAGFFPEEDDEPEDGEEDDYVPEEPSDYEYSDDEEGGDDYSEEQDEEEVGQETVEATTVRRFYSDDLGLEVSSEPFDSQFVTNNVFVPFNDDRGDGWLDGYASQIAKDANAEMVRMHSDNIFKLRERYFRLMQVQCENIVRDLDMDNPGTMYGESAHSLSEAKANARRNANDIIARRRSALQDDWDRRLQQEGEAAAEAAKQQYRARYGRQHEDNLYAVESAVMNEIEDGYQREMRELRDKRRAEAMKMLDISVSATLVEISNMYAKCMSEERQRCDELQQNILAFLDQNRKDDVARIQVLSEQQAQEKKADIVLAEQTAKMEAMSTEFKAQKLALEADLDKMRQNHADELQRKEADFNNVIGQRDASLHAMQERIDDLTSQLATLDEKKKKEYEARMTELESERDAWSSKCDHLIEVHKRSNVISILLVVVAIIAALVIGFVGGEYMDLHKGLENERSAIMSTIDEHFDNQEAQHRVQAPDGSEAYLD